MTANSLDSIATAAGETKTDLAGAWPDHVCAPLIDVLAGRHDEIDRQRRLPEDVIEAMHESDVFRTWLPAEFDGCERPLADGLRAIEDVSYLDPSVGWVAMIAMTTSCIAGTLDRDEARRIFAPARAVVGGTTAPTGTARRVAGGVELSGRWSWGSGIHSSTWMGCGAMLEEGTAKKAVIAFVPIDEVSVLDTWYVSGLKGTGSTDYEVRGVVVPEERVLSLGDTPPWSDRPLHRFALFGMLALSVSSVGLGLARRALTEFRRVASERTLLGTRARLATSPVAQTAYAQAEARVQSAIALRDRVVDEAWAEATLGDLALETRRRLRLAATNAAFSAAEAVDRLWKEAGASVVYDIDPMQRLQRDAHVVTQHFRVSSRTFEMVGALALDQPFEGQL